MRLGGHDLAEQLRGMRPGGIGPAQQTRRRPFQILLMRLGAMLGEGGRLIGRETAGMAGDADAAMEDLHCGGRGANLHLLSHQLIGHAVEVAVGGDVIVEFDFQFAPLADLVAFGRERTQSRLVERGELAGARAFAFAEWFLA